MRHQITHIELETMDTTCSARLYLTTSNGSVWDFGCNECGATLAQAATKGLRPNTIDQKVLEVLANPENWKPPSHRDIAKIVGCHNSYISKALRNLQKAGKIDFRLKPTDYTSQGNDKWDAVRPDDEDMELYNTTARTALSRFLKAWLSTRYSQDEVSADSTRGVEGQNLILASMIY